MSTTTQIQNINQLVETFLIMHGVNVTVSNEWKTSKIQTSLEEAVSALDADIKKSMLDSQTEAQKREKTLEDALQANFAKDQEIKALLHQRDERAFAYHNSLVQFERRLTEQEAFLADYKREVRDAEMEAQKREETFTAQLKRALDQVHDLEQNLVEWEVWRRDTNASRDGSVEREKELEDCQHKLSDWVGRATTAEDKIEQLQQELKAYQEQLSNATWELDDFVEREWNLGNASRNVQWGQGN